MNYIGSKYSLLNFIDYGITKISNYKNGKNCVFADLFAGTGTVGKHYKAKGFEVISNDIQYYSYVLNKHYIENIPPLKNDLLEKLNSLEPISGFIFNNYCKGSGSGRNYFTNENGRKCDAIRTYLEILHTSAKIADNEYFYYLASLINSIDKYANTASVYGAFLKHIKKSAAKMFELALLPVISGKPGKVYNEDVNILIKKIKGDILYLDPPYNTRQYSANYHILETIAKYDNPKLSGLTGLRDYSTQKSKFCSKYTACETFNDLIKNADFKYIFLSYNNEGLMPLNTIKEIMSGYGKYSVFTKEYKRFKADKDENRKIAGNEVTEYLHCLVKN
nr:DNA adenine methylase [uncultured Catonella sp.]